MTNKTDVSSKFKKFMSDDIMLKIVSLIIAVFLWFIVMNTINPTEVRNYPASIVFENASVLKEQGLTMVNEGDFEDTKINLRVEATRPALDELSKNNYKNNITAQVDLSKVELDDDQTYPVKVQVPVRPSLPSTLYTYTYDVSSYYPTYVEVEIDRIDSIKRTLRVSTTGSLANGYTADNPVCDVTSVTVTGPASQISNVAVVRAEVDLNDSVGTIVRDVVVKAYDASGNELTNFTSDPATVTVTVPVSKQGTITINQPKTTGTLPSHLEISSIDWEPKSVSVAGTSEEVNSVSSIDLPTIDLSKITGNTTLTFDISKNISDAGLQLKNSSSSTVTVNIKTGVTQAKKIQIKNTDINIIGLKEDCVVKLPDSVTAEIGGPDNITAQSLKPSLDLTGLDVGTHKVELKLNLPNYATLKAPVTVDVTIYERGQGTTVAPSDENNEQATTENDDSNDEKSEEDT